jgi:uncharacterized protein (DUF924 family)
LSGIALPIEAEAVLSFWFRELSPAQWFEDGRKLDAEVRQRFAGLLARARRGEFDGWVATPRGRLALIILLDQFSRHIHRDHAEAFASDLKTQRLTKEAIDLGADEELNVAERQFLYLPLMHAEDPQLQALSVESFEKLRAYAEEVVRFAVEHREQIDRFGRFPHRNAPLGRDSTADERAFMDAGGNSFS